MRYHMCKSNIWYASTSQRGLHVWVIRPGCVERGRSNMRDHIERGTTHTYTYSTARARAQKAREEEHHENMKQTACISAHIYSCQGQRVDKRFSRPPSWSPSSPTISPAIISPSRVFINYSDNVWNFTSWPGDVLIRNNSERIVMKIAHVHRCSAWPVLWSYVSVSVPLCTENSQCETESNCAI